MSHIDGTAGSKQSVSLSLTFVALELNTPTGEDFLEALHSLFLDRLLASPFPLASTWPDLRHGFLCIQLGCSLPTTDAERSHPSSKGWLWLLCWLIPRKSAPPGWTESAVLPIAHHQILFPFHWPLFAPVSSSCCDPQCLFCATSLALGLLWIPESYNDELSRQCPPSLLFRDPSLRLSPATSLFAIVT